MKIGYARVSTDEQNLDLQRHAIEATGCEDILEDQGVSGATVSRPALGRALAALQAGGAPLEGNALDELRGVRR